MFKKLWMLAALAIGFVGSLGAVSASGCFHDAINVVNKAGTITRGAYILNVACYQGGQTVIATLSAGTKVRIVGESAYTKIVLPDGRVGWVGNDWVSSTNDWTGVPSFPTNHVVDDYCDTTNPLKCPVAIPPGVPITQWYYKSSTGTPTSEPTSTQTSTPTTTTTTTTTTVSTSTAIQLTDAFKLKLDDMVLTVSQKIDAKYGYDDSGKLTHYNNLVAALKVVKKSAPKLENLIDYLVSKFEEKAALMELSQILNIE